MNAALIMSIIIILEVLYFLIQVSGAVASSESKLLQHQQQNQSFIAKLTGANTIPPVNTNATGTTRFQAKAPNNNELYYEINLTNIHNDVAKVDVHIGKETENGPSVVTLYQTTLSLPSEICCRSAASESERDKFFFNSTISTQSFELGPLAGSKNMANLTRLFDSGNAYVEVYTHQPKSLSFLGGDREIRGQIMPLTSK
jgi:hypothetical protein